MEKRILYLDCSSGISGDMFVAAMLDLGANEGVLRKALDSLPISGFEVRTTRVVKNNIDACDFDVALECDNHDHDMDYLYGDAVSVHEGHHEHRNLTDIMSIIDAGDMSQNSKKMARHIFSVIADAESEVHGEPVNEVRFHEVGAVDSIVDVVSAAVCIDDLGFDEVAVSELTEGSGTVRCQHGMLPVPVPAVSSIVKKYGLSLRQTDVRGEHVTPTGAAIVASIRTMDSIPDDCAVLATGYGAGKRRTEMSGLLRAVVMSH